jgi:multiple sugar transport system permease protein
MSVARASGRGDRLGTIGSAKLREALVGYAFVIVPMAIFALFFFYPLVRAFYISRYEWGGLTGKAASVGLGNYWDLYHDDVFRRALKNTLMFTVVVVPLQMALGLVMAIVVNQKIRARTFFRAAFYFPSLVSSAAITVIAIYILYSGGLLNHFLESVHLGALIPDQRSWFDDSDTALWSIVGLNAWTTSGTMMLFYLASLQSIPTDVYEAAAIDGASAWRTFWRITFPLLKPGHYFVAVVSVIGALKVFDQAFIVSKGAGGPAYSTLTVVLYLYRTTFANFDYGHGAAIGVVLFVIIFSLTLVQRVLFGKAEIGY